MPSSSGRTGSSMSAKQIAYAATRGRQVILKFLRGEKSSKSIKGYVVGADDYHWLVAEPVLDYSGGDDHTLVTHLVAKGRVDIVTLSPDATLEDEPTVIRLAVEELGRGFRSYCARTYFGASKESEEPPTP